jgi:hypothetical protein
MRTHTLLWTLFAVGAALALAGAGCEDDTTTTDDGGRDDAVRDDGAAGPDADADVPVEAEAEAEAGADADGDAETTADEGGGGTGTLTVLVNESTWPSDETPPLAGATVALDMPGGGRVEDTTDAEGRVTFEELNWAAGTAGVTAYLAGYAMASRVGIVEADGEIELTLWVPGTPEEFVTVSGTALNMADETHDLQVTATVPHELYADVGPDWSIEMPTGMPFTLVGLESHNLPSEGREIAQALDAWTILEHAAVTEDTTIDLDFDAPVTPTPTLCAGSFDLPPRAESPLRAGGFGYFWVSSLESDFTVTLGLPTHIDINGDWTAFEYEGEYLELASAVTDPMTIYLIARTAGERSIVIVDDYPTPGEHELAFIDLPEMVAPATPSTRHPLHDPITWNAFDTDVETVVTIIRADDSVWGVRGATDATSITVPQPPATADVAELLGTGVLEGRVTLFRRDETDEYTERSARSHAFILAQ